MEFLRKSAPWIFLGLVLAVHAIWIFLNLDRELWCDEIISLNTFALTDIHTIVTYYPDVNNHLLFNLFNFFYTKMVGMRDFYDILEDPTVIRMLPAIFSFVTIVYVFATAKKFFPRSTELVAPVMLITSLLFVNFSLQLRGYPLSMTCAAALLYHFLHHLESGKWLQKVMIVVWSFALGYTIPSNAYFLLGIGSTYALIWLIGVIRDSKKGSFNLKASTLGNNNFTGLLSLAVGGMALIAAYYPILDQLKEEPHIKGLKTKPFDGFAFGELLPEVLHDFVSARVALPFFVLIGGYLLWASRKEIGSVYINRLGALISIFVLPMMVIWMRGDTPHVRTMTQFLPLFVMVLAVGVGGVFSTVGFLKKWAPVGCLLILGYCLVTHYYNLEEQQEQFSKDVARGHKDISAYGHLSNAEMLSYKYLEPFVETYAKEPLPVLLYKPVDRITIQERFNAHGVEWFATVWARPTVAPVKKGGKPIDAMKVMMSKSNGKHKKPTLLTGAFPLGEGVNEESGELVPLVYYLIQEQKIDPTHPRFYVVTGAPYHFEQIMAKYIEKLKYTKLNKENSFYHSYLMYY